ncbi:zinc finger protein 185 isoform X3 [Excalfactoria chinensis]|uniref:zinc finger protein 185 isoform X3 n=1 Tax=Excalfactoria chinensis TaxID=46218 RepID=UPI003B3A8E7D
MMSLAVSKDRVITPTDEDRRRIIKQMKVRTTLKGDKSWIHHQNSDSEDEKKSSPLSGRTSGGSTASAPIAIQSDRSPASKPQSGYLIRGVFTKTIDKTPSVPNPPSSKAAQKSTAMKGPSSCHSSGYRMTTEDYKKLAPYNVKQKSVDLDEKDVPFSPDEHKKRTEAANSVLRRTASRERAYVLSAAKKSSGSPTQEFPPLFAKRIEIEEEGQQRRNPTVSDSRKFTADDNSTNGLKKPTVGPSWNAAKTTAVSPTSAEIGTKSQTNTTLRETSEKISTYAEIRNGESRQTPNGNSSLETVPQHEDGDKKSEPFSWDKPGATAVSTNGSYSEHTEANNGFYLPRSDSGYRDRSADAVDKLQQQYKASPYMDDAKSEPARSEPGAGTHSAAASSRSVLQSDVTSSPAEGTPAHLEDAEYSFKRSVLNYDERGSTQENRFMNSTVPAYSKPDWSEAKSFQDFKEVDAPRNREHESTLAPRDHKLEVAQGGFSDSNHHAGNGQEPPDVHPEPPMSNKHTDHDLSMAMSKDSTSSGIDNNTGVPTYVQSEEFASRRSSSLPREGSTTAPKTQSGNESNTCWESKTSSGYEEQPPPTMHSHHESPGAWRHNEPSPMAASRSNFSSKESALGAYETQHPMPLYMDRQPFNTSVSAPSHRIPSYVGSQGFSTRRPILDYEGRVYDGRSSPRSSRYDSVSARGHCEFNLITTRLLSSSSERICTPIATLPYNSPAASGYQPDSSTAGKGVLFVKEYVNSSELSASPRYGSLVDLTDLERGTYSHHRYVSSAPLQRSSEPVCTYCSREIRDCPKIIIEHLNIYCHEYCFRCGICHKAMGDLLDKIFIHRDIVHCDKCYEKLF